MPTAIFIDRITKSFPAPGGVTLAVNDISLQIEPGELFFLLGPSGCGKTTLLRMIAGFIEPTSGRILFGTGDSSSAPPLGATPSTSSASRLHPPQADLLDITRVPPNKRNTGMVFQSYALWPHMTVAQNVAFGLEIRKVAAPEREQRVREALAAVHMGAYAERRPNQLSGGQQQRVALARALVIRPSVLLLDEPLSNLDAKLRLELRSEIRRICKDSGITTIYVTHDQKEALSMADRVAILDAGRVVQLGPPEELYRRPANRFVAEFLGETNIIEAKVLGANATTIDLALGNARLAASSPSGLPEGVASPRAGGGAPTASASSLSSSTSSSSSSSSSSPSHISNFKSSSPLPSASPNLKPGSTVSLSIRPESIRLVAAGTPGAIPATLLDTTYLGELAQHHAQIDAGPRLRLSTLNPAPSRQAPPYQVYLAISPEDAVVLPPSS